MKHIFTLWLLISFQIINASASIFHEAIPYIPNGQAASHATRLTYRKNLIDYATKYKDYIQTGKGDPELFNLITSNSLKKGFQPFNLSAYDIEKIANFLQDHVLSSDHIIESPLSVLPDFVMKDYINIVYDVADNWEKYDQQYYSKEDREDQSHLLGKNKNIRHGIADLIYKTKELKYSYVPKTYKNMEKEIKNAMTTFLDFFNNSYEFFENIQGDDIDQSIQAIIIAESDIVNNTQKLDDVFKKNPNLTLILIFNDDLRVIRDFFTIQNTIQKLFVCGSSITAIGNYFLSDCTGLKKLDLSSLSKVTDIGSFFLSDCTDLEELDLSSLSKVEIINDFFLYGCTGLEELDLSSLSKVEIIKDCFLSGCSGLKELNLSSLSKVKRIADHFLSGCSGLKELNLTPLSKIEKIGYSFLFDCSGLEKVIINSRQNLIRSALSKIDPKIVKIVD